jgi:hypothetical protein
MGRAEERGSRIASGELDVEIAGLKAEEGGYLLAMEVRSSLARS